MRIPFNLQLHELYSKVNVGWPELFIGCPFSSFRRFIRVLVKPVGRACKIRHYIKYAETERCKWLIVGVSLMRTAWRRMTRLNIPTETDRPTDRPTDDFPNLFEIIRIRCPINLRTYPSAANYDRGTTLSYDLGFKRPIWSTLVCWCNCNLVCPIGFCLGGLVSSANEIPFGISFIISLFFL